MAKTDIEWIIMISGINSANCILSSIAKERVKSGIIDHAQILGMKSAYTIVFDGSEWNGEPLV
ncbi:LF_82 [Moritella viscosa]|nr:LF_82 [Moritella viscosa]